MEILIAAVDAGSFSAASRRLGQPVTSVSRKVAQLEQHIGAKLLVRTNRNVRLTEAGRDYVQDARSLLNALDDLERRAAGEFEAPRGELTATTPVEFGRLVAVPLMLEFMRAHPEVNLNIVSADEVLPLAEARLDVAIRLGKLRDSSLKALKVGEVKLLTCASPTYLEMNAPPSVPADLSSHHGIVFSGLTSMWWTYQVAGKQLQIEPKIRVRANTASAAIAAAVNGLGITRAPNYQVDEQLRSGSLVRVLPEFEGAPVPVHLVHREHGLVPRKTRAFLDWLAPRLRDRLKSLHV